MDLIAEIDAALPRVTDWQRERDAGIESRGARAWVGTIDGWRFLVVDFETESQGFPVGSRGYDGTAMHSTRGIVFRLTIPQARIAVESAIKRVQ